MSTIATQFEACKKAIRAKGRAYSGMRFIGSDGSHEVFPKGDRHTKLVLENLAKQPADAFRVFANMNDEVAIQELRRLPFYHLV